MEPSCTQQLSSSIEDLPRGSGTNDTDNINNTNHNTDSNTNAHAAALEAVVLDSSGCSVILQNSADEARTDEAAADKPTPGKAEEHSTTDTAASEPPSKAIQQQKAYVPEKQSKDLGPSGEEQDIHKIITQVDIVVTKTPEKGKVKDKITATAAAAVAGSYSMKPPQQKILRVLFCLEKNEIMMVPRWDKASEEYKQARVKQKEAYKLKYEELRKQPIQVESVGTVVIIIIIKNTATEAVMRFTTTTV
ncbi:hypothetical protein EDD11_009279 [Mortierella claussenii]|nr:hypothetical protein EDD11_009279 [Mortierella claussenii]